MVDERVLQVLYAADDRATQGHVAQFLAKNQCLCDCVENADDALDRARSSRYDLIITDFELPNDGGRQIIDTLSRATPTPAILVVTSRWSPEGTIELLRRGIIDVLSKPLALDELDRALKRVTQATGVNAEEMRLFRSVENLAVRYRFLTSDIAQGVQVVPVLLDFVAVRVISPTEYLQLLLSLQEALANAVEHGNLELASGLKDEIDSQGRDTFSVLKAERLKLEHFANRQVWLDVSYTPDRLCMSVTDEGGGFSANAVSTAALPTNLSSHGRGVAIMEGSVDEVKFSEGGRKVTLVKKLRRA